MNLSQWEDLRRQARVLENELDGKLSTLGKMGGNFGIYGSKNAPSHDGHNYGSSYGISEAGNAHLSTQRDASSHSLNLLCTSIEDLMRRLAQVNEQMSAQVAAGDSLVNPSGLSDSPTGSGSGGGGGVVAGRLSQQHTVKRHREILRDYAEEFRQIKSKINAAKEREDLLGSVYRDLAAREAQNMNSVGSTIGPGSKVGSSTTSSSTRLLLDEQERYTRSNRMLDDHIAVASTVRAALRSQRQALRTASVHLHGLAARFPIISRLVGKINWRHRQDAIVLAIVIAVCMFLLLLYMLS